LFLNRLRHIIITHQMSCGISFMDKCKSDDIGSGSNEQTIEETRDKDNVWFQNFRELLFYWQEYYMRRGRDRLSLEFSTNIPFRVWSR
jgi:hypothetical protein